MDLCLVGLQERVFGQEELVHAAGSKRTTKAAPRRPQQRRLYPAMVRIRQAPRRPHEFQRRRRRGLPLPAGQDQDISHGLLLPDSLISTTD